VHVGGADNFRRSIFLPADGRLAEMRNFSSAHGSINQQARSEGAMMSSSFKVGDAVCWNSEAGEIHGKVVKVHTRDTEFMGRHRPASKDAPQYEVKSDKTGHLAMHHGDALKHV